MLTLMKGDKAIEVAEEGADAGLFWQSGCQKCERRILLSIYTWLSRPL